MSDNRISIQAGALRLAVATVIGATAWRNRIPILAHLRLCSAGPLLCLDATNLDLAMGGAAEAEGDLAPTTVPARQLAALLAHLPAEEMVTLHQPAGTRPLELQAGPLKARLFTLPVEDFPDFPAITAKAHITLPAAQWREMLGRVVHAISLEETRYYLNGVYVHAMRASSAWSRPMAIGSRSARPRCRKVGRWCP